MRQIIRYSGQDFAEHPDKDRMIELAMMREYNGVFEYSFTDDCYREMMRYMDERISALEFDVLCYEEEYTENIEQEIIDEMAEW